MAGERGACGGDGAIPHQGPADGVGPPAGPCTGRGAPEGGARYARSRWLVSHQG